MTVKNDKILDTFRECVALLKQAGVIKAGQSAQAVGDAGKNNAYERTRRDHIPLYDRNNDPTAPKAEKARSGLAGIAGDIAAEIEFQRLVAENEKWKRPGGGGGGGGGSAYNKPTPTPESKQISAEEKSSVAKMQQLLKDLVGILYFKVRSDFSKKHNRYNEEIPVEQLESIIKFVKNLSVDGQWTGNTVIAINSVQMLLNLVQLGVVDKNLQNGAPDGLMGTSNVIDVAEQNVKILRNVSSSLPVLNPELYKDVDDKKLGNEEIGWIKVITNVLHLMLGLYLKNKPNDQWAIRNYNVNSAIKSVLDNSEAGILFSDLRNRLPGRLKLAPNVATLFDLMRNAHWTVSKYVGPEITTLANGGSSEFGTKAEVVTAKDKVEMLKMTNDLNHILQVWSRRYPNDAWAKREIMVNNDMSKKIGAAPDNMPFDQFKNIFTFVPVFKDSANMAAFKQKLQKIVTDVNNYLNSRHPAAGPVKTK
jgi:hypothetical protein